MEVMRYHSMDGVRTALLLSEGRKFLKIILMDSAGIRAHKVSISEKQFMTKLDYPLAKAKKIFRAAVRKFNNGETSQVVRDALSPTGETS